MAIYSFSADVFSRSKGHRATAASAYRSASLVEDRTTGERFDYTRKRGVLYSEILAPDNAPAWMRDRQDLWNRVEAQEKRSDSQLAREILLALPHELDESDRLALVRDFIREEFVARGMVADLSIHEPSAAGDERNTHAHVMLTLRTIEGDGFGKKARDWNRDELLTHWREAWAQHANAALSEAGFSDIRVDHRSLEDQGVDRIPGAHKGKATTAQERRGKTTPRSDRGDDIARDNEELSQLVDELAAIDKELAEHEERQLDELYGPAEDEPSLFEPGIGTQEEPASRVSTVPVPSLREGWQPLERGVQGGSAAFEHATPAATSEQHTGWRRFVDRVRGFQARAAEFWADETSGRPEAERGFAARVVDTGRKLWGAWQHRDGASLVEGIDDAAQLAREARKGRNEAEPVSMADRLRERGRDFLHNERGAVPADRLEDWWASVREQLGEELLPPDLHSHDLDGDERNAPEYDGPNIG